MKGKKALRIAAAALSVLCTGWLVGQLTSGRRNADPEDEPYVLRDYQGCVAVYEQNGAPSRVTEIEVRSLPRTDREALLRGIRVQDRRELSMLLEDLGS